MQMWILIRIIKRVPERVLIKKRFTESEAFFLFQISDSVVQYCLENRKIINNRMSGET